MINTLDLFAVDVSCAKEKMTSLVAPRKTLKDSLLKGRSFTMIIPGRSDDHPPEIERK